MKIYELLDKRYTEPIVKYESEFQGWENVPIKENQEQLVSLKKIDKKIIVKPEYYINKINGAENDCKVREGIVNKLLSIAHKLPEGYKLLIWDSFRTLQTQTELFNKYKEIFKKEQNLDGEELIKYTKKFVSLPSLDKQHPSPHNTGAAIDLTICDENNQSINLGTYFDDFRKEAYTRFYEEKFENGETLAEEDKDILLNRRVLCNLFTEEGFVNYPYEIWHKSLGDQMASKLLNKKNAIYGSIEIKEV